MAHGDKEAGHQNYIEGIYVSREAARSSKLDAEAYRQQPNRCFIDHTRPSQGQDCQREAHAAILNYWSDIRPYSDNLPRLWEEQFHVGHVPRSQTIEVETNHYGEPKDLSRVYQRAEANQRPVSLSTLDEWRNSLFQLQLVDPRSGESIDYRRHKIYLPVAAISEVYDQLNKCVAKLNLAAEIDEIPDRDRPPEPPKHVRDEAPAYQGDEA